MPEAWPALLLLRAGAPGSFLSFSLNAHYLSVEIIHFASLATILASVLAPCAVSFDSSAAAAVAGAQFEQAKRKKATEEEETWRL